MCPRWNIFLEGGSAYFVATETKSLAGGQEPRGKRVREGFRGRTPPLIFLSPLNATK